MYDVQGKGRATLRTLAILLIAAVALLRGVIPAGFMLAAADTSLGRFVVLELCDARQQPLEVINLDTGETLAFTDLEKRKLPSQSLSHSPCVFASAAYLGAALTPELAPRLQADFAEGPVFAATAIVPARASSPPPATGPPRRV